MDAQTRMQIEWECVQLCHAFARHLDSRDYAAVAALFADDGVWERHGKILTGHHEIIATLEGRREDQFTRHINTGFHFTQASRELVKSVSYNISYFDFNVREFPGVLQPDNILLLDFIDTFILTALGWRFKERITRPTLIAKQIHDKWKAEKTAS